jgi:hypothetical protein
MLGVAGISNPSEVGLQQGTRPTKNRTSLVAQYTANQTIWNGHRSLLVWLGRLDNM